MIKAIALDDEPPALAVVKNFCGKTDHIDLVKTFTRSEDAMKYLRKFPVDLLFLDIKMPAVSGLEFRRSVPADTMVIFTTAFSEFAVEGLNLNAVDYLLKPFTFERFMQATDKAKAYYAFLHQSELVKKDHILVRVDYSLVKVMLANINLIEGLDDYIKIHLQDQKPIVTRMTMKVLVDKLPANDFIRVHRSYTIPLAKIESVRGKVIFISGEEIPIGSSFEEAFFAAFSQK